MKKKLPLFILLFVVFALNTNAQIIITTADVAGYYKVIYQATDTIPSVTEGSTGTNQTWNMSALAQHLNDTLQFLPYSSAPNASFPTSNLIAKQGWQNNYAYLNNSATSLDVLGNSGTIDFGTGPFTVNQINTPGEKLVNFPTTYGSTFTNNYQTKAKFYLGQNIAGFQIDSVRRTETVTKKQNADAWGSLTTPLGVYNTMRLKETKLTQSQTQFYIIIVSPFGSWQSLPQLPDTNDSVTSYVWWANGVGFPLVTATKDSAGNVVNVQWLKSLPVAGINEYASELETSPYPNPVQNEITFPNEKGKVTGIQIFDITGKLVDSFSIISSRQTFNVSEYTNGIYTYSIIGKEKDILQRGKFVIAK